MKRMNTVLAAAALLIAGSVSAQTKWKLDKSHSNVRFTVTHMTVSEVEGTFKIWDGTVENTKPDFSDAKVIFTIDVNSINTENENRDKHLKSDDFFNAERLQAVSAAAFLFVKGELA